jgi:hypothetical protein
MILSSTTMKSKKNVLINELTAGSFPFIFLESFLLKKTISFPGFLRGYILQTLLQATSPQLA